MPTKIEWTDESWQVTHGCSVVSPGCTNCYAMRMAARLEKIGVAAYAGLTEPSKAGPVWNGTVREAELDAKALPLRWKRPRRIFVNSMSDLFHNDVLARHIAHVFRIMRQASQHTFQVLTKRPDIAADMLNDPTFQRETAVAGIATEWPLPNVWLGTSVEDQPRADERIPHLLRTPAAVRFLSVEPMLERVRLADKWLRLDPPHCPDCGGQLDENDECPGWHSEESLPRHAGIDWCIVGGESGPHARPMHPDWARSLRDQCEAAGVPYFFKQWGEWAPSEEHPTVREELPWAPQNSQGMCRVGKKAAGALLDGREWREFPAAARATPNAFVTTNPQGPKHT